MNFEDEKTQDIFKEKAEVRLDDASSDADLENQEVNHKAIIRKVCVITTQAS